MMTDREVMQQALNLLESAHVATALVWPRHDCVEALRARLAEPETCKPALQVEEVEPVAWINDNLDTEFSHKPWMSKAWTPLYTAPPARRPLTDEEIDRVIDVNWSINNYKPTYAAHRAFARAIERAHKIGGNDD
jgi:hypothetical protein